MQILSPLSFLARFTYVVLGGESVFLFFLWLTSQIASVTEPVSPYNFFLRCELNAMST